MSKTSSHESDNQRNSIHAKTTEFRAAGIQVLPVRPLEKLPDDPRQPEPSEPGTPGYSWKRHQRKFIEQAVIDRSLGPATIRTGIGILTGVSFNELPPVSVIDVDDPDTLLDIAAAADVEVWERLRSGYYELTPGGGAHFFYRCSTVLQSQKLAQRSVPKTISPTGRKTLAELKATGGFLVTAPSYGDTHSSRKPYQGFGSLENIPIFTAGEQTEALQIVQLLDELPAKEAGPATKRETTIDGDRPGDLYNKQATEATFRELTRDIYTWQFQRGGVWYLRRVGKDRGISATWNYGNKGKLRNFSTSVPLDLKMYDAFSLKTELEFGGVHRLCAQKLYAEGFHGSTGPRLIINDRGVNDGPSAAEDADDPAEDEPGTDETVDPEEDEGEPDDAHTEAEDGIRVDKLSDDLFVGRNRFYGKGETGAFVITNFIAKSEAYITEEVGPGVTRQFLRIVGTLADGTPLPAIDVPVEDFARLDWLKKNGLQWARAIVMAGAANRDRARACIELLSEKYGVAEIDRITATGWIARHNEHFFCTNGSAIGPHGLEPSIDVRLPAKFQNYRLPEPPAKARLTEVGRAWTKLLELGPAAMMAPLALSGPAAVLLPLNPFDAAVYLYGTTGALKTTLLALILSSFGRDFRETLLPCSFESTANALGYDMWLLRHVMAAIDDAHPSAIRHQTETTYAKLQRIAYELGNRSGRGRLNADATAKESYYPRGGIVATGEDVPVGASAAARILTVSIPLGAIRLDVLTECQRLAAEGVFAELMAGFVQQIAGHWEIVAQECKTLLTAELAVTRAQLRGHARIPGAIASLLVTARVWTDYLRTIGALDDAGAARVREKLRAGLFALAGAQHEFHAAEDPATIFRELILSAVLSGSAHLALRKTDGAPPSCMRYGWVTEIHRSGGYPEPVDKPRGAKIGWIDPEANGLYLDPVAAFAVAQKLGEQSRRAIPVSAIALGKRLQESGQLIGSEGLNRVRAKVYVAGAPQRVWALRLTDYFPAVQDPETDTDGATSFRQQEVA